MSEASEGRAELQGTGRAPAREPAPGPALEPGPPRRRLRWRRAALAYLALLALSHLVAGLREEPRPPRPGDRVVEIEVAARDGSPAHGVRIAHGDTEGSAPDGAPVVLLLHGSPGSRADFRQLAPRLAGHARVIAPDLAGFGRSERRVPDYSIRAQAGYAARLLEQLGVGEAHVVGFSLGGGVALELAELAPERVRSLVLVGSLGVVELELLGDHHLNRMVHRAQLGLIHGARLLLPHFGALDRVLLNVPYARSFADTDQRALRGILERYERPLLLVHGTRDPLVPVAAAHEHARLVPQSELVLLEDGHFLPWTRPGELAARVIDFVERVEKGAARTRAQAAPERLAAAAVEFDPRDLPPLSGLGLLVVCLLLFLATLLSEDLTCIGAGLLVSQARLPFPAATLACAAGILAGDLALFLAGRWLGPPALARRPLRWLVPPARLERASLWLARRGPAAIFLSRFTPGLRLPTYFGAGALRMGFPRFALLFLAAVALWTPLLVGFSALAGRTAGDLVERHALAVLLALLLALLLFQRGLLPLATHGGRRRLLGRWRRLTRYEFWPLPVIYAPVVLYVAWLALRHRGLRLVTAVNPAIPTGGLAGESKAEILSGLAAGGAPVARFVLLRASSSPEERLASARAFLAAEGLELPLVIKPDAGQRGEGVHVVRGRAELERRIAQARVDLLLQEHVAGPELGVFYVRRPREDRGRIFSVTEKVLPELTGDGERTLEELILDDPRAVCAHRAYFAANAGRLDTVPAGGERVRLVELGTHCRGAIFLDGRRLATPELERVVDAWSRGFGGPGTESSGTESSGTGSSGTGSSGTGSSGAGDAEAGGFHFGRYDLRAPSLEHFRAGRGIRILELNGLTSEATHVYDPRVGLLCAWATLCAQWRLAFEIAAANRAAGARPASWREVARALRGHVRARRGARCARADARPGGAAAARCPG